MTVYVVHSSDYADRDQVYGAFSTRVAAEAERERLLPLLQLQYSPKYIAVTEFQLDAIGRWSE